MMINLVTIDLKTNKVVRQTHVKWHRSSFPWLLKHLGWAFCNGCGIQMHNIRDKEPEG